MEDRELENFPMPPFRDGVPILWELFMTKQVQSSPRVVLETNIPV